MSTIAQQAMIVAFTFSGNAPNLLSFPEASSQTFKAGEPVYLSSGYVTECGDDPSAILGIAADDAHNAASSGLYEVGVYLPTPDMVFEANVYGGGAITAITDVGRSMGLYRDTSNSKLYVDKGDTANHRVVVIGLSKKDAVGDTYGRYLVQFEQKYLQLQITS
jgi:hypothetical protein